MDIRCHIAGKKFVAALKRQQPAHLGGGNLRHRVTQLRDLCTLGAEKLHGCPVFFLLVLAAAGQHCKGGILSNQVRILPLGKALEHIRA